MPQSKDQQIFMLDQENQSNGAFCDDQSLGLEQPQPESYEFPVQNTKLTRSRFLQSVSRCYRKILGPASPTGGPTITCTFFKPLQLPIIRIFNLQERHNVPFFIFKLLFAFFWILGFAWQVSLSQFSARTSYGSPVILSSTDSLWHKNNGCGLDGNFCKPFTSDWSPFRCFPAQDEKLWNPYTIGRSEMYLQPLIIGGVASTINASVDGSSDSNSPSGIVLSGNDNSNIYRADSWICSAAKHAGVIGRNGGCGLIRTVGEIRNLTGSMKNGLQSESFDSIFPKGFQIKALNRSECKNCSSLLINITIFNAFMLFIWGLLATELELFIALIGFGFWHVSFVSDPPYLGNSENLISISFGRFLPTLAFALFIWGYSFRVTFKNLHNVIPIERLLLLFPVFWVGLLINITGRNFPVQRLVSSDATEPGFVTALVLIILVLIGIAIGQILMFRKHGLLQRQILSYVSMLIILVTVAFSTPRVYLHLHHYFIALVLFPGVGIQTRPSIVYQGFLIGWFLNGAARWGFDSILATKEALARDGATSNVTPLFNVTKELLSATDGIISWSMSGFGDITKYSLLIDDVERYRGSSMNYSLEAISKAIPEWTTFTHYFRIGAEENGAYKAFSKAAQLAINGSWFNAEEGVS